MTKIGRNDPCPCGSGKKYKHCCPGKYDKVLMLPQRPEVARQPNAPEPPDEYSSIMMELLRYANELAGQRGHEELARLAQAIERHFPPDRIGGPPGSMLLSALCCDFRYGKSAETVAERFLESERGQALTDREWQHLEHLEDSYPAYYELIKVASNKLILREFVPDRTWFVQRVNEPENALLKVGDVWHLRLLGPIGNAYMFTPPAVFRQSIKPKIQQFLEETDKRLQGQMPELAAEERARENGKRSVWDIFASFSRGFDQDAGFAAPPPKVANTDGHDISFTTVTFAVLDRAGAEEQFSHSRQFEFERRDDSWMWSKKLRQPRGGMEIVSLGLLKFSGATLTAETNSVERAQTLKKKIAREFAGLLAYQTMESKDMSAIPDPSPEETAKMRRESEELNARPEIRRAKQEYLRKFYLEDWISVPVPALGNRKPIDAVKTADGRAAVEQLLASFDQNENMVTATDRFDFNLVRAKLGLPVRHRDKQKG